MTRSTFLTLAAVIAMCVGAFALVLPGTLLADVKGASATEVAKIMTRTVGVLLLVVGALAFSVRNHADSPTLRAILAANLGLQLMILPIDPAAYWAGQFDGLMSFVPNTLLHLGLAGGFAHFLSKHPRTRSH